MSDEQLDKLIKRLRVCAAYDPDQANAIDVIASLRTQLAAEKAEVERLRLALAKEPNTYMIAFENGDHQRLSLSNGSLSRQLAAAQAEARELREALTAAKAKITEDAKSREIDRLNLVIRKYLTQIDTLCSSEQESWGDRNVQPFDFDGGRHRD